ncbi:hypothetical protein KFK09_014574 [Dendrobium nobile]|uniref:Chitin-binding type-1 domain-containing protein n=1 Tax=Dendrobium nobile TaxID=94219 RepID=A0A8T3B2J8_DENNO|nr:hypothetical protein KFK09_014574 [Dendrobium nobile]
MAGPKMQLLMAALLLAAITLTHTQNCGCTPDLCCGEFGYCSIRDPYCGDGCQSGPCYSWPASGGRVSVAEVVQQKFFDSIIGQADTGCKGK